MEEPELGSRATTLGVYYSTQQTNQGFPSISSIQNGYYGHPPTIQAMVKCFIYLIFSFKAFVITHANPYP
jgi:hypothetical protein